MRKKISYIVILFLSPRNELKNRHLRLQEKQSYWRVLQVQRKRAVFMPWFREFPRAGSASSSHSLQCVCYLVWVCYWVWVIWQGKHQSLAGNLFTITSSGAGGLDSGSLQRACSPLFLTQAPFFFSDMSIVLITFLLPLFLKEDWTRGPWVRHTRISSLGTLFVHQR
jgi:hypothetical protein